jgi:hypothetical protein
MGIEIDRDQFSEAEYAAFAAKLESNLRALGLVLRRPGFGAGPFSIGAELELNLVDGAAYPMPVNREVLASAKDRRLALELNRFNLELNATPVALAGRSLSALHAELSDALAAVQRAAALHGARVAVIGILPTLAESDLHSGMLSDSMRYRALSAGLARLKQQPFQVRISGEEELAIRAHDVSFEGANTSFQIHLRVPPERFADTYNAAQLATGPALAAAGNSPFFLGRRLWHETRVALFRQAVDDRADATGMIGVPRASPSVMAGSAVTPTSCSPRPWPSTSRSCPCWAPRTQRACASPEACRSSRSSACTRARCGAGTAPSTMRPPAAICGWSCARSRQGRRCVTWWPMSRS